MDYIIKTQGLTKHFGGRVAVDGVDLCIKKGEIYGLIGPNGAGKTTLMRMLLGLSRPNAGQISLFGGQDLSQARRRIGSLIEEPALYQNESAYENLKRFALLTGDSEQKVRELLELVGLQYVGKKKARQFSLGMRQRLGIAIALLGDPELLVLDEPINGLDPAGIIAIRNVLQRLSQQGVTLIISSHLLDELGKIATSFGVMVDGRIVEQISAGEAQKRCRTWLTVRTDNGPEAVRLLQEWKPELQLELADNLVQIVNSQVNSAHINALLVGSGVSVYELSHAHVSLEQYFVERMGLRYD